MDHTLRRPAHQGLFRQAGPLPARRHPWEGLVEPGLGLTLEDEARRWPLDECAHLVVELPFEQFLAEHYPAQVCDRCAPAKGTGCEGCKLGCADNRLPIAAPQHPFDDAACEVVGRDILAVTFEANCVTDGRLQVLSPEPRVLSASPICAILDRPTSHACRGLSVNAILHDGVGKAGRSAWRDPHLVGAGAPARGCGLPQRERGAHPAGEPLHVDANLGQRIHGRCCFVAALQLRVSLIGGLIDQGPVNDFTDLGRRGRLPGVGVDVLPPPAHPAWRRARTALTSNPPGQGEARASNASIRLESRE